MFGFNKKKIYEERADTRVPESATPDVAPDLLRALLGSEDVTREQALEIPSISGSISLIAGVVSCLPVKLYIQDGDDVRELRDDVRLPLLNHDTQDTLTATQFWRAMLEDYYVGRGAYAYISRDCNRIRSLHYVENGYIGYLKGTDPIFKDYKITVGGTAREPFEFFKILRNTKDGMAGTPVQEEKKILFSVAYHTMIYENTLVRKGGNKKGFLTSESQLSTGTSTLLKEAFRNLYSNNTENVVILNKGMDFKESSNSCVEMQLNENKETNSVELSMLLNVPNAMLRGNATQQDKNNFVDYCIVPLLNDIEASLDRDLLTEEEKSRRMFFAFDTKELTRGNILDRYRAYELAYKNNFMQVDEIREKEDLPALGFNFIKLGLDSVLYNPETKEMYVANTDKTAKMDDLKRGGEKEDEGGTEG